ncbi:MAG: SpvB/TcaC N-terminal domain-containing protein, partial [Caldilineaceae bacterium]
FWPAAAFAQDKSGVKPQVISLPSGPGSLEGLGENFEPNLSTGTSSYPVKFSTAPGRGSSGRGFQPELALSYNGGNANGPWGMGWDLSIASIQRRTEDGLPTYDDAQDQFIYSGGEKLVALKDGSYRFENESSFMRFRRIEGGGWEAQTPDGLRYLFGETANARVENTKGIFRWELERVIDPHGNEQRYSYLHDGDYAYPREIRYNFGANTGGGEVYNAVIFNYAPRPDTYTDRRSSAPIRVGLRGTDIQMWALGKLVRAYVFTYEPERSTGKYSLLIKVEQVGDDGVSKLPPHTFTYTQFDATTPAVVPMQNPPPVALTNRDADLVDINADGLPDVVYTPEDGQHRFYLNRGHGRWQTEPVLPQNSPAERLSNPNVRMADMNGDGRVDLLVKASSTGAPLYYYRNQPGAKWEQSDRVDFGPAPAFDLNDPNVQLMDVNNDHRIDVVLTASGRLKIWLAREGAWSQTADFDVPAPAAGDATNFADPKFKIGDMTGDRMDDVVMVRDGQVVLWEHNGNGSYSEVAYYPFGLTRYEQNGDQVHYRFTGQEQDASGLLYYNTRYYEPVTGRFISVDPLFVESPLKGVKNPQLLNLYAYALNNPGRYTDPDCTEPKGYEKISMAELQREAGQLEKGQTQYGYDPEKLLSNPRLSPEMVWQLRGSLNNYHYGQEGTSSGPSGKTGDVWAMARVVRGFDGADRGSIYDLGIGADVKIFDKQGRYLDPTSDLGQKEYGMMMYTAKNAGFTTSLITGDDGQSYIRLQYTPNAPRDYRAPDGKLTNRETISLNLRTMKWNMQDLRKHVWRQSAGSYWRLRYAMAHPIRSK